MTENQNQQSKQRTGSGKTTARCLVDDPRAGWRRFSVQRASDSYQGNLRLPEYAGQTVRFVFACLTTTEQGIRGLSRLECSEWIFDAAGLVDQTELQKEIVAMINPVPGGVDFAGLSAELLSAQDIKVIHRRLGI